MSATLHQMVPALRPDRRRDMYGMAGDIRREAYLAQTEVMHASFHAGAGETGSLVDRLAEAEKRIARILELVGNAS